MHNLMIPSTLMQHFSHRRVQKFYSTRHPQHEDHGHHMGLGGGMYVQKWITIVVSDTSSPKLVTIEYLKLCNSSHNKYVCHLLHPKMQLSKQYMILHMLSNIQPQKHQLYYWKMRKLTHSKLSLKFSTHPYVNQNHHENKILFGKNRGWLI